MVSFFVKKATLFSFSSVYISSRYYDSSIGRFISPDEQINSGILGANLYAYCLNDPINMVDFDGREPISVTIVFGAWVAGTFYVILLMNSPGYKKSVNDLANALAKGISRGIDNIRGVANSTISWISSKAKEITKSVINSFARAKTKSKYKSRNERHHIVAKKTTNASYAKKKLIEAGLYVNHPENLIWIKTGLHRRIHTNLYYGWANSIVISAFNAAKGNEAKQKSNVIAALRTLRRFLENLNKIAPY